MLIQAKSGTALCAAALAGVFAIVMPGCGDQATPSGGGGGRDAGTDSSRNRDVTLVCETGVTVNECGGCGPLGVTLGDVCEVEGEPPEGHCVDGIWACDPDTAGEVICDARVAEFEICDGIDNDCDTLVDEDFDLDTDANHCGDCDTACTYENGVPGCEGGVCVLAACQPGWADADHEPETGCEATCTSDSEIDVCDWRDNDCDGTTDEDFVPVECGIGVCRTSSSCVDGLETECTPLTPPEEVESICDGIDNNCDGEIDEGIEVACENDCGSGVLVCSEGEFPACSAIDDAGRVCIDIQFFCETIPVELEMPLPTPEDELGVDVAFLFDRSGSFGDDLVTFRNQATTITDFLSSDLAELAVGLGSFVDAPCGSSTGSFGSSTDFGYELNLRLTSDLAELEATLLGLDIRSGADGAESQLEAMYQALTGEGLDVDRGDPSCRDVADIPPTGMGWRERSLSFLFVSTDADFHHPSDVGYPYPHAAGHVIAAANAMGTRIYFLQAGTLPADPDASTIASATGGEIFNLSSDSAEIAETVTTAVFDALTRTEIELVPEGDDLGFITDIEPSRLNGLDLLTNRNITLTVTLLSTVDATGEVQTYTFDLVFLVNGGEIARRPVVVTIPAEDPKDCTNRPPIIRRFAVPDSMTTGQSANLALQIDEPDGNPVTYDWRTTSGTISDPGTRDPVFTAPGAPGLVDVSVTVGDTEDNTDFASHTIHVKGGSCSIGQRLEVGYTEGRMVIDGDLAQTRATSTCGGAGSEAVIVLGVHRRGTYRFTMDAGDGWNLHMRGRDCASEMACVNDSVLEVELEEGSYFLFVDTVSGSGGFYRLYAERLADEEEDD